MGIKGRRVMEQEEPVRTLMYNDGHFCKTFKEYKYDNYLLDNKSNEKILDEAIKSKGIKLIIAPTGAGKSHSLIERANLITSQDKDCKVIIALPLKTLTLQMGKMSGVYKMVGGDIFDINSQIIATTYEKMFEVEDYILHQRFFHRSTKVYLILDESHLLVSQHLFREKAIKCMIRYIEQDYFKSVLLVTATPSPMSLFRCDEIIEFESNNKTPAIEKIQIVVVDDVIEYIKNLDYDKEFPFIRLNNKTRIEELIKDMPQRMVRITKDDKNTPHYMEIVENSRIDNTGVDGMLVTSVLEAGVNITDYPDNIVPMAVYGDCNISADDIEQFLNRIRRTGSRHVRCARVVLTRPKERELKAELVTMDGKVICNFTDLHMELGTLTIHDVSKMDAVQDGDYKVRILLGKTVMYRNLKIISTGKSDKGSYRKGVSNPLVYQEVGFRPFLNILKANYKTVERLREKLQENVEALSNLRETRKKKENLSDMDMDFMLIEDDILIGKMIKGVIADMGEMKDCLSYENGQICLDKRILYMVSYNQFQRQYYYNHEHLKRELEERMNTKVDILEENTSKGKHSSYNPEDIWEDMEDIRQMIICDDEYWKALTGNTSLYFRLGNRMKEIQMVKKQTHLLELLKEMDKAGVNGKIALKILTSCKSKGKITQYVNCHKMIVNNQILHKFNGQDIREIPSYNVKP